MRFIHESHHFLLEIASFSQPMGRSRWKQNNQSDFKACLKKPVKFQENERQVSCGKFCNFCFQNSYSPPPPQKKKWMNLISNLLSTTSIKYMYWPSPVFGRFQNGCVVQFWSEMIIVISNRNHVYDFSPNCTPLSSIPIINVLHTSKITFYSIVSFYLAHI